MSGATLVATLGLIAMVAVLTYGFLGGDFAAEGKQLLGMPWGRVSLVDLYAGFALFCCWILYRDGVTPVAVLWIAAVMVLGSLAICLYVLVARVRCRRDWAVFLLGRHADKISCR